MMKKPIFIFALVLIVVFAGCISQNQQTKTTTTRLTTTTTTTSTTTIETTTTLTTTTFTTTTSTSTTTTTVDKYYCEQDSDCVGGDCCHSSSCINKNFKQDCAGIPCTEDCRGGTMDCGQGKCICNNNKCVVYWIRPIAFQGEIPDDYSLGSIDTVYKSCENDSNCTSYCGYLFQKDGRKFGAGECVNTAYDFYSQPKLENAPLCEQDTKINCYSCSCIGGLCYSKKESEYC